MKVFVLTYFLLLTVCCSNAARILAAFVFPGKSHFMMTKTLIKELIYSGHEVTFITSDSMGENLGENFTEVLIPKYDYWTDIQDNFNRNTIFDLATLTFFDTIKMMDILGLKTTEYALMQPNIREIFETNETKNVYDLLIVEQFYQEAFLALAVKFDIPVLASCTLGHQTFMSQMMGLITPWSFVPHGLLLLDDKMNFWQRLENTLYSLFNDYHREYSYLPKQDALVEKYLSHLPVNIPSVSSMEKNISVMLLNSYAPLDTPRPTVINFVPVGGMHIYPPKPLPADLQKFLDEAKDGAIYLSLGTNVKSSDLPPEKLKAFVEVFAGMKQRVLWKFEDDNIPDLSKNVMVKKWMPQSDVLAHPNVKVFITHGGLFGTQEGVHYGVPMLGIPVYADQFLNIMKATKAGYAMTLNFHNISKDSLKYSLTELLENPSYRDTMQRFSQIFRDRPLSARDNAMYWVDYVIRHKGAYHMRSAGLDLAWYEFYLLDVIGFIFLSIATLVGGFVIVIKYLMRKRKQNKVKVQ